MVDQRMDVPAQQLRLALVTQHLKRRPVDESAAPSGIDAVQTLRRGIEQALERLLPAPDLVLCRCLHARAVAHEGQAGQPEQEGEREVQSEQQALAVPSRFAKLRSELVFERRQSLVEHKRLVAHLGDRGVVQVAKHDLLVRAPREQAHLLDHAVAFGPRRDGARHQRRLVEQAEQADHAGDFAVVGTAVEEALARHAVVGVGLLKLLARGAIRQWRRDRRQEAPIVLLAVEFGVVDQIDLGVLLSLRIEAFAGDVGTHRREHVDADDRHRHLQRDDQCEDREDRP